MLTRVITKGLHGEIGSFNKHKTKCQSDDIISNVHDLILIQFVFQIKCHVT